MVSRKFFRRILFSSWWGTMQFQSLASDAFDVNPRCCFLDLPPLACLEISSCSNLLILMMQKDWRASSSSSDNSVISVNKTKCQLLQQRKRITGLLSVQPHIIYLIKNKPNVKPGSNDCNNSNNNLNQNLDNNCRHLHNRCLWIVSKEKR